MPDLSIEDRTLGVLLGLGDLHRPPACMGYQNACVCGDCLERAELVVVAAPVSQPWEPKQPTREAA